ncbi:type IV toxin-antitoxin system AbiEi family antitoxin domain-containing protein [Pyrococcus horikoshii]|uniref:AbiEi antitoxin C-terminal domain-containing protein n=2 Tax=Pyrococcus horikoshii TaxID=53953 RepID=O58108_PYRHO|nr:hypothetical protein [Pyrococcus horikoshii]BAA29444.1 266aa long hypothetical protein [Pyrococcus horikoshii OT3]HII61059.1 hypothetical protein [Pyrococcus horikoshii]
MEKNYYLTKTEQRIFNVIKHAKIITVREVAELFPELSRNMICKALSSLEKKGYLYRIKNGLYLIQQAPTKGSIIIEDPYRIALAMFSGYIAFSSALRLYNLIEYEPFTVFVATPRKSKKVEIDNYIIQAVALGEKATGITLYNGVYTSTLAKTFFDCFYKPQYCGGYETITKALYEAESIDWKEFLDYFKRFASPSLFQRTGYILELMNKELNFKIPKEVLEFFRSKVETKTKLVPTSPSRGKFIKEWKLLDNLGKDKILGWAYGY